MRHSSQNACCSICTNTLAHLNTQWNTPTLDHFVVCDQDYVFSKEDSWSQNWCSLYIITILLKAHTHEIFIFFLVFLHWCLIFPTPVLHVLIQTRDNANCPFNFYPNWLSWWATQSSNWNWSLYCKWMENTTYN